MSVIITLIRGVQNNYEQAEDKNQVGSSFSKRTYMTIIPKELLTYPMS